MGAVGRSIALPRLVTVYAAMSGKEQPGIANDRQASWGAESTTWAGANVLHNTSAALRSVASPELQPGNAVACNEIDEPSSPHEATRTKLRARARANGQSAGRKGQILQKDCAECCAIGLP